MSQVSQTISSTYGGRIELNQKDSLNLTFTDVTTGTLVMKTPGMGIIYRPIKSGVATFESDCLLEVGIYNVDLIVADVVKTSFEVYAELHTVTQGVDITIDKDMLKDALKEMDLNKEENFVTTSPVTNPIGKIYKGYSKAEADKVPLSDVLNDMLHEEEVPEEYTVLVVDTSLLTNKDNKIILSKAVTTGTDPTPYGVRFENVTNPIIDWGDGTVEHPTVNETHTHTYTTTGIYTIKTNLPFWGIIGPHNYIKQSLIEVKQISSNYVGCKNMFKNCQNLKKAEFKIPDSVVTCESMFISCPSLEETPILTDDLKATSTKSMFSDCESLTHINFSGNTSSFDNDSILNAASMFYNCKNLLSLPSFIFRNATDIKYIFNGCISLKCINQLMTYNVTDFTGIFMNCKSLTDASVYTYNIDSSDFSYNFTSMFSGCNSLIDTYILLELKDGSSSTITDTTININADQMFRDCKVLTKKQEVKKNTSLNSINSNIVFSDTNNNMYLGCNLLEILDNIIILTKSKYDALTEKDETKLYIIKGE